MTFKRLAYLIRNGGSTIAIFGAARLIQNAAGHIELRGGSLSDRRAAREWCSHFLHEAVIDVLPCGSARPFQVSGLRFQHMPSRRHHLRSVHTPHTLTP